MMCGSSSGQGCCKVAMGFVIIAVIMGILACVLSAAYVGPLMYVAKFFDVMLPILGVGALVKYLFSNGHCCSKTNKAPGSCDVR